MKCKEICERIEASYPVAYACEWDNPGLLVGSDEKEVSRIYLALDATESVIEARSLISPSRPAPGGKPEWRQVRAVPQEDVILSLIHISVQVEAYRSLTGS